jgi:predicted nucleotidyltransferase
LIDHLEEYVKTVTQHLRGLGVEFAVVGGIAVSLRTIERFTKDVDFAVSVEGDREAQSVVESLRVAGFRIAMFLERDEDGRLATVRLKSGGEVEVFVDLLFATSGIENEIIADATPIEVFPGFVVKLASIPALIAMKLLSADWDTRPQDVIDLGYLIKSATQDEIARASMLIDLITERGFNRNKELQKDLDGYIEQFKN